VVPHFRDGLSEGCTYFERECVGTVQGHERSLISVSSGRTLCNFLLVINSNLGAILSRLRDTAGFLLKRTTTVTTPYVIVTRNLAMLP